MGRRLLRDTVLLCVAFVFGVTVVSSVIEHDHDDHIDVSIEDAFLGTEALVRAQFEPMSLSEAETRLAATDMAAHWHLVTSGPFDYERPSVERSEDDSTFSVTFAVPGQSYALLLGPLPWDDVPSLSTRIQIIVFGTILAAFITLLLRWPNLRRIRAIEAGARAISSGELAVRVGPQGGDELGALAQHFDRMADGIQARVERQRTLLHAIAHEYRTPLARARFGLDGLIDAKNEEEMKRQYARADRALEDLDALVSEVLEFARLDALQNMPSTEVLLGPLLTSVVEDLEEAGLTDAIDIQLDVVGQPQVIADIRHVRRVATNLLSNGLRHAKSRVRLRAHVESRRLLLTVDDDGVGVPKEEREMIFEPFRRLDAGRSREDGGSGLGLAIVRRTVEFYGGTIEVRDSDDGGASFLVVWPLQPLVDGKEAV